MLLIDHSRVVDFLDSLAENEIRLLVGINTSSLSEGLALCPPTRRPIFFVDCQSAPTTPQIVEAVVNSLATRVSGLWPYLWGQDFSRLRDDALSHKHLPILLAALAKRLPQLSQAWALSAIKRLLTAKSPRIRDALIGLEWRQLVLSLSPDVGLTVVTSLSAGSDMLPQIRALEWLAQHAKVSLVVLTGSLPQESAYDDTITRILFGARQVADHPDGLEKQPENPEQTTILILPPAPEGVPHPMSPAEQKLHGLIQDDAELKLLFGFNRSVPGLELLMVKADLLWIAGRVVVEIDGHDHRAVKKYRDDRHRDYELMCAGYRVLRLTNDEVETDAGRAVHKIRTVVRLAQGERR